MNRPKGVLLLAGTAKAVLVILVTFSTA